MINMPYPKEVLLIIKSMAGMKERNLNRSGILNAFDVSAALAISSRTHIRDPSHGRCRNCVRNDPINPRRPPGTLNDSITNSLSNRKSERSSIFLR